MKQLTFNTTQLLFVGVPMDAYNFYYNKSDWDNYIDDINCIAYSIPLKKEDNGNWANSGYVEIGEDALNDDIDATYLGTIQKSNGIVSTTIPDEVLEKLYVENYHIVDYDDHLEVLILALVHNGLILQEGEKKAVLKIK